MKSLFSSLLLIIIALAANAQSKVTLSGYVKNRSNGETALGAEVRLVEANLSTLTNAYGFYSITVDPGTYTLAVSTASQQTSEQIVVLNADQKLDVNLIAEKNTLDEVIISDKRKDANVRNTDMGTITLSAERIKKLPVLFGESDVLKAIQLLPGVQSAGEGNSGLYVRGGGPDQNLILLDEAVVYNTGHLFGFFSVFNSDAIKSVTLIKGGMPANYGGRLSSVLDVSMKDGNNQEFHGEGGIGLIASRLTLEGPIVKDKGSFMVSGRRTYIDILTKPFLKGNTKGSGYYFYDLNLKANYNLGPKDRVFASGYFGRDVFKFNSSGGSFKANIPWGNATGSLRWNHEFGNKLFMNTTAIFNDYKFTFNGQSNNIDVTFYSAIRDYAGKVDFDYFASPQHKIKFGAAYTFHTFTPNQVSGRSDSLVFSPNNALRKFGHEAGIYLLDEFSLGSKILINAGLRYSYFGQVGPYTYYEPGLPGVPVDSISYPAGKLVKSFGGLEPRINLRWTLNNSTSIKASASRSNQYIHLVANNGSTLPTDIWVPSTQAVKPQMSWQYSAGFFKNFLNNSLETSVEFYYKDMANQIEYRNGYTPSTFRDPELDFVFGKGYSYGAELFINKTKGRFTGWIGYTLSWTFREFPDLNNGDRFPAKYDRRHDLSLVGTYDLNKNWTFSSVFVFGSGNAITLPTGLYFINQNLVQDYSKINQYRIFPYHRLDISATYTRNPNSTKRVKSSWNFSIYNVYSRMNPYFLFLETSGTLNQGTDIKIKQVSIFPILPSITWNFKF